MSIFEPSRSPWTGRMLSILRIVGAVVFAGAGPWSMDAMIARKKGGNSY